MKKSKLRKDKLSNRVRAIDYSVIRKAFSFGRKKGVINLTIGQPDFETPDYLKKSAQKAISEGQNKYTETKGLLELRKMISAKLFSDGIVRNEEEIIITSGTTSGIFMTLFSLINPGDEVIIFAPYFIAYLEIIKLLGGKAKIVRTNRDFQPDIDQLKKLISKNTKAIIINSPNNPTGVVYPKEVIEQVVEVAKGENIYIISDEIYSSLVFDQTKVFSPAQIYPSTIVINGISKMASATGWRVGFVAGPKEIVDAIEKIQQYTNVCAPSVFQYASIEAILKTVDKKIIDLYQKRRDITYKALKENFEVVKPLGAFYLFVKLEISGTVFAKKLLDKDVAVVPGEAFGKDFKNYIRISFAIDDQKLKKALIIIKDTFTLAK